MCFSFITYNVGEKARQRYQSHLIKMETKTFRIFTDTFKQICAQRTFDSYCLSLSNQIEFETSFFVGLWKIDLQFCFDYNKQQQNCQCHRYMYDGMRSFSFWMTTPDIISLK